MGCVFGKGVSSSSGVVSVSEARKEEKRSKSLRFESDRKVGEVAVAAESEEVSGTEVTGNGNQEGNQDGGEKPRHESRRKPNVSRNLPKHLRGEQVAAGWPSWLASVAGEAINGWLPRRADSFEKIDKIGQGTYSNVYKAKDTITGDIVALKKVRFDSLEPESVKFMAREILILRKLDHPNVIKLEGLVTSRMSCSLYLVFKYMEHDLAGLAASPDIKFTEPQVKCYVRQLLSGLEHCHNNGVLHRDIKGSNLLVDDGGVLKIGDFGLASFFDRTKKRQMTSRVVTLWYRPPELLLGATDYDVGVDLWSAGCILAELLAGRPIMPGRTEVEQLHKIYQLCGSPSDEYWKKSKLPNATLFRPREPYKRRIAEKFKDFPPSSIPLIETVLSIDPAERLTATAALNSDFFKTKPYACDPSALPKYPPTKEMDAKRRDDEARRQRAATRTQGGDVKKSRPRDRLSTRAMPAAEANAELQTNIDRRRMITRANAKSKSEKFPPPHQDGALGHPLGFSHHIDSTLVPRDGPCTSTNFTFSKDPIQTWSGPLVGDAGPSRRKKAKEAKAKGTSKYGIYDPC
ncbi:hypothetical protein QQ045_022860 [Rhodiola kirilowii]